MAPTNKIAERRTSADVVYEYLYDEIISLRYLPGAKISEAEIATRFDVSRQPVRDAFSRLENLGLLLIRPQKATEVKRFSLRAIATARFVRAAVEAEIIRRATRGWNVSMMPMLQESLVQQESAVEKVNAEAFHALDYKFHRTLCQIAEAEFAFDTISESKAKVDRLCVLSLMDQDEMKQLLNDHTEIVKMISAGDEKKAVDAAMVHLSRLDATIIAIRASHSDYFED